jgi:hypothetical protein
MNAKAKSQKDKKEQGMPNVKGGAWRGGSVCGWAVAYTW